MLAVLKEILIRNKRKVILPLIKILEYIEKEKDEIYRENLLSSLGKYGEKLYIGIGCNFVCPDKITLGNQVIIFEKAFFQGQGGITIGDNVIIASNCSILTANHVVEGADALPYGTKYNERGVIIKDNVWIGMKVSIVPGVTIGEGAVVGMGAVVTRDVPPCAIVGGNPAKVIKYRNREQYEFLVRHHCSLINLRCIHLFDKRYYESVPLKVGAMLAELEALLQKQQGLVMESSLDFIDPLYRRAFLYHWAMQVPSLNFVLSDSGEYGVRSLKELRV